MDKYIGRLLDNRYEILEVLGTGGMAVVYKARCHRLNRLVAIKILKDEYMEDEDFRARFHAESQAVAMLSHPNIVQIYDVSTSIMADYIVMELIDGITLKQYMEKKGVLNWKETLHFAIQIAKALEHAHSRGIVHRDIKPHNIMVLKNGSVKVADFGIARMMSEGNTLTKEALGSVHYISPEQAKGGRVDNRSDIYSLGVVMYEMMAGRPPYDGDSPVSVAIAHINGGAPLPSTYNPNIPGGMEQIIMKAMAHDLSDRYPSATRMLADMDEFRKDPSILFDYNLPPIDAVTNLQQPAAVYQPESSVTTAQRIVQKKTGERPAAEPKPAPRPAPRPRHGEHPMSREERNRKEQEEQKRNKAATAAIITCSAVAMIAVIIFLVTLFHGNAFHKNSDLVEVPQLVHQVFSRLPEYPGLDIIKNEVYDETFEEGVIIKQSLEAGEQVVEGSMVVVTVSMGPPPQVRTMQNLKNMTQEQAFSILNSLEMNLVLTPVPEFSDTVPENSVIRTEPAENTELTAGQEIVIYISQGREIKTSQMPDVVKQSKEYAEKILNNQDLYLRYSYEEVFDSVIPEGKIVRTEPEAGSELKTGQSVKIYISKGAEKVKVPNVEGLDITKAVDLLRSAGFGTPTINPVESDKEKDTVITQSEKANSMVDINTEIILEISKGSEKETEPVPVYKDVVLTLDPNGLAAESQVLITREGREVFNGTVAAGTSTITISNQSGNGIVTYTIHVNNEPPMNEKVSFSADE